MANPMAGEVGIVLDGQPVTAKLTLGALAELEAGLAEAPGDGGLMALIGRFETGAFSQRDVLAVLVAGLRGGGWQGGVTDLLTVEIGGGPAGAARVAAELLLRAFRGAE
ncbi:gene transfer agent family protein [Paracoccus onubensis]|uniref:gene transfer agent family protein n=1 Tax=Paracoccus onubensis TaxID=1675788 RepID=UPI00272EFA15|nr:gene transfer agent family protein [Paracoccus onubensis]MDP0928245.1 gene transfer agent family protein [Paracoccus onubensis]